MSSEFIIEDNTDESIEDIEGAVDNGLKRAALYAETKIVESMIVNPEVQAGQGGWKKSFGRLARSQPGSPPMQQTGNLARSIISGKVGHLKYMTGVRSGYSDSPYGFYLDQGTTKIEKRPWLGVLFRNKKEQIEAQFKKGHDSFLRGKNEF